MNFICMRRCLFVFVLFAVIFSGQKISVAMSPGDVVPNVNSSAVVKPGEVAKALDLPDLNGKRIHIDFKEKPTVLVSLGLESDIAKLPQWQSFYDKHKSAINFYLLAHEGVERTQNILKQQNLNMPVVVDDKITFVRKYNNGVPALFITDKDGVVIYNSLMHIDINSLNQYINKLLKDGKDDLPSLRYEPMKRVTPPPPPPLMSIGTVLQSETFKTFAGDDYIVKYSDKPTVLLFWADFNQEQTLDKELTVLQQVYEAKMDQVNFYTVNFGNSKKTQEILERHHSTVPALLDKAPGVFLKYSRAFPSIVIIDPKGVIRYRPRGSLTAEELGTLIERCREPYVPLPEPRTAEEWLKRGDEISNNKNYFYLEAVDAYNRAIKINPSYYEAYLKRAQAFINCYDYEQALKDFNKMIEIRPEIINSYYLRATTYIKLGKFDLAIADYSKIIELDPDELRAYFDRAGVYVRQGNYSLAVTEYTQLLRRAPGQSGVYINRGICYHYLGQYDAAIADYSKALDIDLHNDGAYDNRGLSFTRQGVYDRAIEDFTKAIELRPRERYYEHRAMAYARQQDYDLAIGDFTKIINLNPEYRYAYFYRGIFFVRQQEYTRALTDFFEAQKRYPRNGNILFALAQTLELTGDKEQALGYYKDALEYLPIGAKNCIAKAQKRVDGDWENSQEWVD